MSIIIMQILLILVLLVAVTYVSVKLTVDKSWEARNQKGLAWESR